MGQILYNTLPPKEHGYVVAINGAKNTTDEKLLQTLWRKFGMPKDETPSWDAYLDWMRDLSWIEEKIISVVIIYADAALEDEPYENRFFLQDFERIILPFWEDMAIDIFEDKDKVKDISLYLFSHSP